MRWAPILTISVVFFGCAAVPNRHKTSQVAEGDRDIPDMPAIRYTPASQPPRNDAPGDNNVRVNSDNSGFNQAEISLSINPTNPQWVVASANDARTTQYKAWVYHSQDGGVSWSDALMPFQKYIASGDPGIAHCGDGTVLYSYLDFDGAFLPHRFIVARSTDNGQTWLGPGLVQETTGVPFADRPQIACAGATGTFANRAYVSWTQFNLISGNIRVAFSDDRGQTWLGAKNVSGSGVQGSMPVVGRNGAVYVFWQAGNAIQLARSTNGAGSFSAAQTISSAQPISDTNFRRPLYPSAAIDLSGGPFDGSLYVVWADQRFGDPDIVLIRSTDGGSTWSSPTRVNPDPQANGRDQFLPWVAVDETGTVLVKWYDRSHDAANVRQHVLVAASHDGGRQFDLPERATDVDTDGGRPDFCGDYCGVAARAGRAVPMWADGRTGTGEVDVYTQRLKVYPYDLVKNLRFLDRSTISFDDQEPRTGTAIVYDVVRGDVADLPLATRATLATCERENLAAPPLTTAADPPAGHAWYYIVRAQGPRGSGSFGRSTIRPNPRESFDGLVTCGP